MADETSPEHDASALVELTDAEVEQVAGGLNPQPEPPGRRELVDMGMGSRLGQR